MYCTSTLHIIKIKASFSPLCSLYIFILTPFNANKNNIEAFLGWEILCRCCYEKQASLLKKLSQTFDQNESLRREIKDGTEVVYPQSGIIPRARIFVVYRTLLRAEGLQQKTHHRDKGYSKQGSYRCHKSQRIFSSELSKVYQKAPMWRMPKRIPPNQNPASTYDHPIELPKT